MSRPAASGFTLIELAVGLSILAFLVALGVPAFSAYLQNVKISNTAKSVFGGMQLARAEAIRRNATVEFMLTDSAVSSAMATGAAGSATGKNWLVRAQSPTDPDVYTFVEAKAGAEGSGQAADASTTVAVSGPASIQFNGLGGTLSSNAAVYNITNPAGGDCAKEGGPMRCLQIVVAPGGQLRLCDPKVALGGSDSRACPGP